MYDDTSINYYNPSSLGGWATLGHGESVSCVRRMHTLSENKPWRRGADNPCSVVARVS